MAGARPKNTKQSVAFDNKQLKFMLENEISKNIGLTCMGLSLERSLKNKDKSCSPPWKHIVQG